MGILCVILQNCVAATDGNVTYAQVAFVPTAHLKLCLPGLTLRGGLNHMDNTT